MRTSSARSAAAATLGMVATTAGALSDTVNVVAGAATVANQFMDATIEKQRRRYRAELAGYNDVLKADMKQARTERLIAVAEFRAQSAEHAKIYDTVDADVEELFAGFDKEDAELRKATAE